MDKTNAKLKFLYLVVTALNHDSYEKDENVNFGFYVSDRPKQCFTVLPKQNRTSQSKFCFPNRNRTEPNM